MADAPEHRENAFPQGYLVFLNGPLGGGRFLLRKPRVIVGRHPDCDLIPEGELAARVSGTHIEVFFEKDQWYVQDLKSTNGTWVNHRKITRKRLKEGDVLMLGQKGPEFQWELDHSKDGIAETLIVDREEIIEDPRQGPKPRPKKKHKHDKHTTLLLDAVKRAREARVGGEGGETAVIMREVLATVIVRSRKKLKITIAILSVLLVLMCTFAILQSKRLAQQKKQLDLQITQLEVDLLSADDPEKIDLLISELDGYQKRAKEIQKNLLYQMGARDKEVDFIEAEIRALMGDFGAVEYSIPPEFSQKVRHYIRKYRGQDRSNMQLALGAKRNELNLIREILTNFHLPPDLAFIVLVESGFRFESRSHAGAVGPWQFVPATARSLGLKINAEGDERTDLDKSSRAAGRYLRKLIADFGAGQSFMLALAAYNLGPTKVRRIIRQVENPIKQRDFWYLYRTRAFPEETREYVPKIFAAIIIGRNPQYFGFESEETSVAAPQESDF